MKYCDNKKNSLTMRPFKKYVTCIKAFYIPSTYITLCQFYSITSPMLLTKNKLWNERKEDFFVCMAASGYHVRYIKGGRKSHYGHNRILDAYMYKQPILTK